MPTVCAEPGCPERAVRRGRCPRHLREQRRRSPRPSDRAGWRAERLRRVVLRRDRTCRCCEREPASRVHHVVPLDLGGADGEANAVGLCSGCHAEVHSPRLAADASATLAALWRSANAVGGRG